MGKNFLIVGASSGIGKETAKLLAEEGNKLWLASRSKPELDFDFEFQELDVTKDFQLELPDNLDGLIYCPGSINLKPFKRFNEDAFIQDYKLNALGAAKVIQQAEKSLKNSDKSSIVLFSTVAVQTGLSFHSSIAMAKGAIEGLARALAAEFAPKVRVNVIAPSLTDTPLASSLLSTEEKKESNAQRHPLKAIGTTKDMAKAAKFLVSEDSSWITAQVLTIDGGLSTLK